jgi:signal transduction histidine kinase
VEASEADGRHWRWSLRTHLLAMAGVAVALSAVVGGTLTTRAYSSAERRAVARVRDAARQTAATVGRDLAQAGMLIAASAPGIGPTLEQSAAVLAAPELCTLSFTGVGVLPAAGVLSILTADGRVLCSSNRAALGRSYADAAWYPRLAAGEVITVGENADVVTGGPAAVVAAPVRTPAGSVAGALVSVFSADPLATALAETFGRGSEREYTIVDPAGTVISSSIDPDGRGRPFPSIADGETTSDSRGTERIWSLATVEPTGWRVWAATDEAEALGPARAERERLALVLVVALAAAVALALLVNRRLVRPVRGLSVTIGEAETEPGARAAVAGPAELAGLARSLNQMLATRQHNEQLVAELAEELEATAISLIEAREQERQALAIALHDTTLQGLVAAMWQVDALTDREGVSPALDRLRRDLGVLVDQTRAVTTELRPPALQEIGLGAAVDELAHRATGDWNLTVEVEDRLDGARFAVNLEMLVYRAIQESLQNVRKHAQATRVQIILEQHDDVLRATVADDGVGVDDAVVSQRAREGHLGVVSMRDTIRLARGRFSIARGDTGGTVVELEVPLLDETPSPVS